MRVPASLVALPLVAGTAAGLSWPTGEDLPACAAAAAILALLAAASWRVEGASSACAAAVATGSLMAGLSLGCDAARRAYAPPLLRWFHAQTGSAPTPVLLEGVLREDAAPGAFGVTITLAVTRLGAPGDGGHGSPLGGARLSVAGDLAASHIERWVAGRVVRVAATLREPAAYLNPGLPDDRRALARRGVVLVGSVKSAALVEIVEPGSRLSEAAAASRAWVRESLAASVGRWSRRSQGVAAAILLGDRTGLDRDDERRLQEAGTYHVIAISGGNIAVLTALLLGAFRLMRAPPRAAAAIAIALLLFYGEITAPASSVDRAITAATVYLGGRVLDHSGSVLNVLAVAATLAVAASPVGAFDPGFILSFGATLGILVGVPRILAFVRTPARLLRAGAALLAATLSAEVALAPVGAVLFSRMTAAGLLVNFAAIPLMTVVQAGAIAALGARLLDGDLAGWCGYVVHLAVTGLVDSARLVDAMPWLARDVVPPAWGLVVFYYAAAVLAVVSTRARRAAAAAAAVAFVVMAVGGTATSRDGQRARPGALGVAFLDVGQGDATLLTLPDGRALLVDAGGFPIPALQEADSGQGPRFDIGERVVAPALRALGVRRLDALVLTHGDPDHVGGAPAVLRLFRPRAIWEGVPVPPHPQLAALAAAAEGQRAEWRTVQAGDSLRLGPVRITALHPPLPEWERQRVRNDDSIVLVARYGDVAVVLPGDVGAEGEAAALAHWGPAPLVILKAAHHGSASSSTPAFLAAVRPAVVVFSAGRANRFGHPAPAIVSRVRRAGAATFSTAEDGAVIVETDGRMVHIRTWKGRSLTLGADRDAPDPGTRTPR